MATLVSTNVKHTDMIFQSFLGLRVVVGLYIDMEDLLRAMCAKIVAILPSSRTIFRPHFALRTLCDTSELITIVCVREWS